VVAFFTTKETNTKNGRAKMHAKLLCQMDRQSTKLKGCVKHVECQPGKHIEYDSMNGGMVNQDGKHRYLMMQSMSKLKEEKTIIPKALTP
jgi:hypothetical protein